MLWSSDPVLIQMVESATWSTSIARVEAQKKTPLPCKYSTGTKSNIVVTAAHSYHFIVSCAISPPAPTPSSAFVSVLLDSTSALSRDGLRTKVDGPELSPLAGPHSQRRHQGSTACLERPPEEIGRDSVGVKRGDDKVDEVYGKRKIEDELGARNKQEDKNCAGNVSAGIMRRDL